MGETEDYDKSATPTAHASSHENGGSDEISVASLSGQLADSQPSTWTLVSGKPTTFAPSAHKTSHQDGGADEISVAGLSGTLADAQTPAAHKTSHQDGGADEISVAGLAGTLADAQTPAAHKTSHQDAGADEISVTGLAGLLVTAQTPTGHHTSHEPGGSDILAALAPAAHKTSHQDGGSDEISVTGLAGTLADAQTPAAHKTSHQDGGADEISVAGLAGELTDLQKPKDHTHQSAGSGVGGKLDHGLALDGLTDDDHTQYIKHALATAESDFLAASGAGAFVKKTLAETKTILGITTGGDPGEGHITILVWLYSAVIQGTWAAVASSGQILYGYLRNNTHDDGDQVDYKLYLAAGTYTFSLIGQKDTDCGIIQVLIDAVSQGTIDTYGAAQNNVRFDLANLTITTAGLKTLSLKVNGKNASSSNHYVYLTAISLYRTA